MTQVDITKWSSTAIAIVAIALSSPGFYSAFEWFKDINFYRKNGWNFKEDSGIELYKGAMGNKTKESRVSNKMRVFFGMPFYIFVWLFMAAMMSSELWRR
jgi:hypothetical protein